MQRQRWQNDWLDYPHEMLRVLDTAAEHISIYSSARIGEHHESSARVGTGKGLLYRVECYQPFVATLRKEVGVKADTANRIWCSPFGGARTQSRRLSLSFVWRMPRACKTHHCLGLTLNLQGRSPADADMGTGRLTQSTNIRTRLPSIRFFLSLPLPLQIAPFETTALWKRSLRSNLHWAKTSGGLSGRRVSLTPRSSEG